MTSTHAGRRFEILTAALCCAEILTAQSWLPPSPYPGWGACAPATIVAIAYDPTLPPVANGARLHTAILGLGPGQGLAIGPGTWTVPNRLDLSGVGTPQAPYWLFAAIPSQRPVITRPNANQNAVNMGSVGPARYWVLRDLEITGGSDLLKLYDCAHIWIDHCYLHDGLGVGIAANVVDTDHLHLTHNEIARPGPGTTGEGMYLGANWGAAATSWSVIAHNYVHDTRGAVPGQGDGIELKQGSHHNWVLGNYVHGCQNPCILVYGTGGNGQNVVEGNICCDSDDVVLQVQGEALVRNNIALGGAIGFGSHDHQGQSVELEFVHNTIVSQGRAASMSAWNGRPGMVFANNVVYSLTAESIWFSNGSAGVQMAGNLAFGSVHNANGGFAMGSGLQDFEDVSLTTFHFDARPVVAGAIDNRGSPSYAIDTDLAGNVRSQPIDPGAFTNRVALRSPTAEIHLARGGIQELTFDAPQLAGAFYLVLGSVTGTTPGLPLGDFTLPLNYDFWMLATALTPNVGVLRNTLGFVGPEGLATATLVAPPLPAQLHGVVFHHAVVALQQSSIAFVSNPVSVMLQ
ncbi:MAG TPA: right-handed parallel beta-helix repeat-containing protein [Planctomycetota bacterium]|nr:right-handed parallel beta-helix repeat-containing protein [Planctomycetota bacterium]